MWVEVGLEKDIPFESFISSPSEAKVNFQEGEQTLEITRDLQRPAKTPGYH